MSRRLQQIVRIMGVWALAAWLSGCTTPSPVTQVDTGALEQRAQAAARAGDDRSAADLYVRLADLSSGSAAAGYLLEAARAETALNNLLTARDLLERSRAAATAAQHDAAELLLARIEYLEQRPEAALQRLAPLLASPDTLTRASALEIQGLAQFALGRPIDAIESLSEREIWLDDIDSILANQRTIWLNLFGVPSAPVPTGDAIVDGWLALAPIARIGTAEEQRGALLEWRRTYRQHPAARVLLTDILSVSPDEATAPRQIALLLPLSTNAREPARAIRDGFLAAHMAATRERSQGAEATTVRVYDTGSEGAEAAYLRAQVEGADFIVGPLIREEVQAVLAQSGIVTTLTLNHTLSDEEVFGNTFQFALSPEDEAVAVARRAIALGQRRAVVLVPSNDRGYRIYDSFREEYEALGGEVLDFMGYDGAISTYGQRIEILLNLDRSNSRERTLQANLREDIEFFPRRRRDIDMIFLIANASDGRQLAPQLEYYYAGDIPTYAISEIYEPGARDRSTDLNRVIFPEVPWLIDPGNEVLSVQRTIDARWPQRSVTMARFFGMGLDSYRIVSMLYRDPFFTSLEGATGLLRMDTQGRIHRDLPFARFSGASVELIDAVPEPEPFIPEAPADTPFIGREMPEPIADFLR